MGRGLWVGPRGHGRGVLWAAVVLLMGVGFALLAQGRAKLASAEPQVAVLGEDAPEAPAAPVVRVPGELALMPAWGAREPYFPWLEGEDQTASRSVGEVTQGFLVQGVSLPQPHPHLAVTLVQYARGLVVTSQPMLALLEDAAGHLAKRHPGSVVFLGNLGAMGGGPIPYSVSHQSGRDADLAFFMRDALGEPVEPPDLLALDEAGEYRAPSGEVLYRFDGPRNWALVEGLVRSRGAALQYIFVARPLRAILLEEALKQGAAAEVVERAKKLLVQPAGALPHDDHFHVRIHCTAEDAAAGCREQGPAGPDHRPEALREARAKTIRRAIAQLVAPSPDARLAAVRRLALLNARAAQGALVGRLGDEDAAVRAAAARALGDWRDKGAGVSAALRARLSKETDPQVMLELVEALVALGDPAGLGAVYALLENPLPVVLWPELVSPPGASAVRDARALLAQALARREISEAAGPLVAALASASAGTALEIDEALRLLTNHALEVPPTGVEPSAQALHTAWLAWLRAKGRQGRDAWLVAGFSQAGYPVGAISPQAVWELCEAVDGPAHVSFNAQRALMRLAGREVPSLLWSREDASLYWRRHFERRQASLKLPPMPPQMATRR